VEIVLANMDLVGIDLVQVVPVRIVQLGLVDSVEHWVGYFVWLGPVYNPHTTMCIGRLMFLVPELLSQDAYFARIVGIEKDISLRTSAEIVADSGKEF